MRELAQATPELAEQLRALASGFRIIAINESMRQTDVAQVQTVVALTWTPTFTPSPTPVPSATPTITPTPRPTPTEAPIPISPLSPPDQKWFQYEDQPPTLEWTSALTRALPDNEYYRVQVYHTVDKLACNLYTKDTRIALPPARREPCDPGVWDFNTGGYNWRVSLVINKDNYRDNDVELENSAGWLFEWHK